MIKLTFLALLYTVINTVHLQETSNTLLPPNTGTESKAPNQWLVQEFQGDTTRRRRPCSRRRNQDPAKEQWIPSFSSRISFENSEALSPQSLTNENQDAPSSQITLTTSPSRRSNNDVQSFIDADDCEPELDYKAISNLGEVIISMLRKCLQKNQRLNEKEYFGPYNRRFMSDDDNINTDSNDDSANAEDDSNANRGMFLNSEDDSESISRDSNSDKLLNELIDPTRGDFQLDAQPNSLPQNGRVCYACSTATNPSCWEPDKRTTIKYCKKGTSCLTKTFGPKNSQTIIRDCARSCDDSPVGIGPKYLKCSMCNKDLCNGAYSINSYNILIVLVMATFKCTFY